LAASSLGSSAVVEPQGTPGLFAPSQDRHVVHLDDGRQGLDFNALRSVIGAGAGDEILGVS
jgi:hypothetical protein